jgi:hypothetical protein
MGTWTVQSCQGAATPLSSPFGHNFLVRIRMKYTPSAIGKFVEPPILAWDEVIQFNNYADGTRWEFIGNMYEHKPGSPTVAVWGQRYFRAYLQAHGTPYQQLGGKQKGHSKLLDKGGMPVPGAKLGVHQGLDAQNNAVRDYLKRNGGMLEIEVHDIPGIVVTPGGTRNVERVLSFDCGVKGMGPRVKAWQHLKIDQSQPQTSWIRNFQIGSSAPGMKTSGLKLVIDPAQSGNPAPAEGAVR